MRSILTRFAIAGFAGAIAGFAGALAIGAAVPASAAVHHKRAPAQEQLIEQPVAARPDQANQTNVWRMQNDCVSDEGFGRYSSCDGGGGGN
jgi:hypothetical protein